MKKKCPKCNGTGKVIDSAKFGPRMREIRMKYGYTMKSIADGMSVSLPYLCQLESGNREWNNELIARFKLALRNGS